MFDPGSIDLQGLMAQAQAMQDQLEQAQAELASKTVRGTAGGDLVEATVTGTGELVALVIKPEVCDPNDTETLADLVVAAVRDANHQAMALAQATMPPLPELGL
ncbi:YbaB/EbfC family nucleoid-associated protein [Propionicimonas sp.]|uniref:YbaB/EbfC family nucleoid-associated protein n=1 Tax=Propionicimonas sp. TaxID=1955623 RepID=UPI0039E35F9C